MLRRGPQPLQLLPVVLSACRRIVAFNADFDLRVTAAGRSDLLRAWSAKVFDPMALIESHTGRRYRLAQVLAVNHIEAKGGSGAEAPGQWARREFDALQAYNVQDVWCLALLVLRPQIKAPGGMAVPGLVAARATPVAATEDLVQQSAEWFQARRDKITASAAAGLLSLSPFTTRQSSFERLVLNARSAPTAAMQRGIDEESGIADMYVRIFPQAALQPTGLWTHPEHTWLVSSPDRLLGEEGLLEVKRFSRLAKPGPNVLIQVLIQLECTGRRFCDIIQYDGTRVRVDRVERDRELQEDLVDLLHPMHEAANAARASGSHVAPPLNMRDWEELKAGLRGLYVQRLV